MISDFSPSYGSPESLLPFRSAIYCNNMIIMTEVGANPVPSVMLHQLEPT